MTPYPSEITLDDNVLNIIEINASGTTNVISPIAGTNYFAYTPIAKEEGGFKSRSCIIAPALPAELSGSNVQATYKKRCVNAGIKRDSHANFSVIDPDVQSVINESIRLMENQQRISPSDVRKKGADDGLIIQKDPTNSEVASAIQVTPNGTLGMCEMVLVNSIVAGEQPTQALAGYLAAARETCKTRDVCDCDPVATKSIVIPKSIMSFRFPECLENFKNVTTLDANGTKVSNTRMISALTNLEVAKLAKTGINTILDVAWIGTLDKLNKVDLSENKIPFIGPEFTGSGYFDLNTVHGESTPISGVKNVMRSWVNAIPVVPQFNFPETVPNEEARAFPGLYPPEFEAMIQQEMPRLSKISDVGIIPSMGEMICAKAPGNVVGELPNYLENSTKSACSTTGIATPGYTCTIITDPPLPPIENINTVIIDTVGERRCPDNLVKGLDSNKSLQENDVITIKHPDGDVPCERWNEDDGYGNTIFSLLRCVLPRARVATASARRNKRRY